MTIREFIKLEEDIDVYDDVCEELAICFCGPQKLTAAGIKHFLPVLDYEVEIDRDGDNVPSAVVHIDDEKWRHKLHKAKEFFNAAAGYCSEENYSLWFCE